MTAVGARADADAADERAPGAPRSRLRTRIIGAVTLLLLAVLASSWWWAPRALAKLAYFRVRRIEIDGARYTTANEILGRLRVDTSWSVWTSLGPLGKRLERDPLVAHARIERKLPGTLRVVLTERVPAAMVPIVGGIVVLDENGRWLPIEPSRVGGVDVPVLAARDSATLRVLGMLRDDAPEVFARISEARRASPDEVRLTFAAGGTAGVGASAQAGFILRAGPDLTPARLADIRPVESDLARRRVRFTEIDLRFRDQVIARLQ